MSDSPSAMAPVPAPRSRRLAFVVFALLAALVLALDVASWRPPPIYKRYLVDENNPAMPIVEQRPVRLTYELSGPIPRSLSFPANAEPGRELFVRVTAGEAVLAEAVLAKPSMEHRVALAPAPSPTSRLVVEFSSRVSRPNLAPQVSYATMGPGDDGHVERGPPNRPGLEILSPYKGPLLVFEYGTWTRHLRFGWILALVLVLFGLRHGRVAPWALVAVGLCVVGASVRLWLAHYGINSSHYDADGYARNAQNLWRYLTVPEARERLVAWFHTYPHVQNSLAPSVMVAAQACGLAVTPSYVFLSACAGCVAVLVFHRSLREGLGLEAPLALAGATLFAVHAGVQRAFARPVTDALGLCLVVIGLDLLLARSREPRRGQLVGLGVLAFFLPLARPQGPAIVLFLSVALVALELARERRLLRALGRTVATFFPATLAVLALYLAFDWFHNTELMLRKARLYRRFATWPNLGLSLLYVVQALPVLWCFVRLRRGGGGALRRGALLFVGWMAFYVVMLVVVQAPYWPRHFLPLVPGAIGLAVLGCARLEGRQRGLALALLLLLAVIDVAWVESLIGDFPEPAFALWID